MQPVVCPTGAGPGAMVKVLLTDVAASVAGGAMGGDAGAAGGGAGGGAQEEAAGWDMCGVREGRPRTLGEAYDPIVYEPPPATWKSRDQELRNAQWGKVVGVEDHKVRMKEVPTVYCTPCSL